MIGARWGVAAASCLGLALLTLNVSSESHFERTDASPAAPATSACAANAKPANLNFPLKDVEGKDVKLASPQGKVVLLDFWAPWFGPCKIEIPWFIQLRHDYGHEGARGAGAGGSRPPRDEGG